MLKLSRSPVPKKAGTRDTPAPKPKTAPVTGKAHVPASSASTFSAASTKAPRAPGVKLIDNQQYFPELMKLLNGAKKSVRIVQYNFFSEKGHGKDIVARLIQMKHDNPKLNVQLFIEGDHGAGAKRNALTIAALRHAGIDVQLDSKNLITHAKAVEVDDTHVLAGSHNMTDTSMDKNNEVSLSISSPTLARAYAQWFAQLEADPSHVHPGITKSGNVTMITDTSYEDQLLDVIKNAKTSIDASMYDLDFSGKDAKAQEVMDALVAAAGPPRNVKVNLWLEQSSDPSLPTEITQNNIAAAKYLDDHGVNVHLDDPKQISHQKFLIRDKEEVLLGSTNWTESDFDERHQINWRVHDPALARKLAGILQSEIDTESSPPVSGTVAASIRSGSA